MVRADTWFHQIDPFAAIGEYGVDRLRDLVSTNVAPGWEAVWLVPCDDQPCRFPEIKKSHSNTFGEPYWTAQPAMKGLR
jgi:hypothetical protein